MLRYTPLMMDHLRLSLPHMTVWGGTDSLAIRVLKLLTNVILFPGAKL
jgi:hypothetical protein